LINGSREHAGDKALTPLQADMAALLKKAEENPNSEAVDLR
jgi:hypothetical protein